MSAEPSLNARAFEKLLAWASGAGIDRGEIVAGAGLDAQVLADPDGRVPIATLHRAWGLLLARSGRRDAPLEVARMYSPSDYALVGFLCQHCPTLAEALANLTRFSRLWTDEPRFAADGPRVTLVYRTAFESSVGLACASEAAFAELLNAANLATGQRLRPVAVSFAHPAPADRRPFDEHLGVEVTFDAPAYELVLPKAALATPLTRADPLLVAFLQGLAAKALERYGTQDTLQARVMELIAKRLHEGIPAADHLARELGMSERTLRRRLESEGTGLRDLVDATRAELAREYIRDRRLPLAEVAYLLGFSEVSAFHRAFKRWTGETPASFRARNG